MTNQEVFKEYGSEKWVIEQNLCFMLQEYWECIQPKVKDGWNALSMPENPVSFVKKFMKRETICDVEYAEKSKISTIENNIIGDADFIII